MATPTAWLMNLDADVELSSPRHYRPSVELEQRIGALIERMGMLIAPGDVVLAGEAVRFDGSLARPRVRFDVLLANGTLRIDRVLGAPALDAREMRVLAFCPTPHALGRLQALGLALSTAAPSLEILREANGRAFCARVGQTLAGAAYVYDMETLQQFIRDRDPRRDLVLKRAYGFAGRERRRVIGGVLDPSTAGFAERSFRAGEGLQVEPWLPRERDFSLHGYLNPEGELLMGPLMRQECDPMGRWQQSSLADRDAEASVSEREQVLCEAYRAQLEQELARSAQALHGIGYFGPFGIDAFEYLDAHGKLAFQPRCEINARFSMGFPRSLLERALTPRTHAS